MDGKSMVVTEEKHLIPLDKVNGYDVRPGFYGINGATALREGVNFTVCSLEATAVELLLYHPMQFYRFRSITGSVVSIP